MLLSFHTALRDAGLPVGLSEWMTLARALQSGAVEPRLDAFYQVSRSIVCRDETDFPRFDQAFVGSFKELIDENDMLREILENMAKDGDPLKVTDELREQLEALSLDEVLQNFYEQLAEEHFKNHQGGNKAIGKYGRSTQGADGYNPAGVRIGQASSRHKSAVQIAEFRRFQAYRSDQVLDTRDMQAALRLLKRALPVGPYTELDLDASIDKTCRNGGEIEMVFSQQKKPTAKVVLLLDVGGSMDPYSELVSRLFSSAKSQLKDLRHFYFHNCVYEHVWEDATRREKVSTQRIIEQYGQDHWLIVCGDAAMSPYELMQPGGSIDLWHDNSLAGIDWLGKLHDGFVRSVWLNPEPQRSWDWTHTCQQIRTVFPMQPLTLDGLKATVEYLRKTQVGKGISTI